MSLERRLTRMQYSGDTDAAKGDLFAGMLVLNSVREQIRLSSVSLPMYRMEKRLANGVIIEAISINGREQVNIYHPPQNAPTPTEVIEENLQLFGFICHPRSDSFPGGRTPKGEAIAAVYAYPLIDNDHGSVIVTPPKWGLSTEAENYGNIDWLVSDGTAVSFRGPCGRSLKMDSLNGYPGFTLLDYETSGIPPETHYTPYQNLTYTQGNVLLTFPKGTKVIGACDVYTVLGVDYAGQTNPDGGTGGFYTELWKGLKSRVGVLHDSRPDVPWFFNKSSTEAVSSSKKLSIIKDDKGILTAAFSTLPLGSGTDTTAMVHRVSWNLTRKGDFPMYYDYVKDVLSNIDLKISSSDSSIKTGDDSENFGTFPVKISGTLTPEVFTITLGAGSADPWGMGLAIVPNVTVSGVNCGCSAAVDVWSRTGFDPGISCNVAGDRRLVTATRTISCAGVPDAVATITVDFGANKGTGMGWAQTGTVDFAETTGANCYGNVCDCGLTNAVVYSSGPTMYRETVVACNQFRPGVTNCVCNVNTPMGSYSPCTCSDQGTAVYTTLHRERYVWVCLALYSSSLWYVTIYGSAGPTYVP